MASTSGSSNWLGEREPSHRDVASANERLDPDVLSDLNKAILSSGDAQGTDKILQVDFFGQYDNGTKDYTYPLSLLSNFPILAAPERLQQLSHTFCTTRLNHIFFDSLPSLTSSHEIGIPPLRCAVCCLASVCSRDDPAEARDLFLAGTSLWPFMVEVDNTLARSVEMLVAGVLLVPYGLLATSDLSRRRATLLLSSCLTIARRLRLHESSHLEPALRQRLSLCSSTLWSLWLWDVLHSLHFDLPLNFSSHEVSYSLPVCGLPFPIVYKQLLQTESGPAIEACASSSPPDQDAVILLLAIMSDAITLRNTLGIACNTINVTKTTAYHYNPHSPLSAHTEMSRIQGQLLHALGQWSSTFGGRVNDRLVPLYHYARMYLVCQHISILCFLADYHSESFAPSVPRNLIAPGKFEINDQTADCAWAVLDSSARCTKSTDVLCPAWMPVVVFHAALVVWAKMVFHSDGSMHKGGRLRALLAFKVELEAMGWPCCEKMASTLERLMSP